MEVTPGRGRCRRHRPRHREDNTRDLRCGCGGVDTTTGRGPAAGVCNRSSAWTPSTIAVELPLSGAGRVLAGRPRSAIGQVLLASLPRPRALGRALSVPDIASAPVTALVRGQRCAVAVVRPMQGRLLVEPPRPAARMLDCAVATSVPRPVDRRRHHTTAADEQPRERPGNPGPTPPTGRPAATDRQAATHLARPGTPRGAAPPPSPQAAASAPSDRLPRHRAAQGSPPRRRAGLQDGEASTAGRRITPASAGWTLRDLGLREGFALPSLIQAAAAARSCG